MLERIHDHSDLAGPIKLPAHLFTTPPILTEALQEEFESSTILNNVLLSCLAGGTQKFILPVNPFKEDQVNQILEGIFPDMVTWHFLDGDGSKALYEAVYHRAPESTFVRKDCTARSGSIKDAVGSLAIPVSGLKFNYVFPGEGNWIESSITVFRQLIQDLEEWQDSGRAKSDFIRGVVFSFIPDAHYFKQIIQTRTLHLIWQNFCALHVELSTEPSDYLETHIYPLINSNPDHYLIQVASSALAAEMAGSTSLCIHPITASGIPGFYHRIDRNVHHLLAMEGGFPKGHDPVAGAYTLDNYTRLWTERIWNGCFGE